MVDAADAIVVADGPRFSVDLATLDPCVRHPPKLQGEGRCDGLDTGTLALPIDDRTALAAGVATMPSGTRAIFAVQRGLPGDDGPASPADARQMFEGMIEAVQRNWPGSKSRASEVRVRVLRSGAPAYRGSITTTGAPGPFATFDHEAVLIVGPYTIFLMGPRAASAEMDRALEELEVVFSPPVVAARDTDSGAHTRYALIAGAVVVASVIVWHRTRRRSRP
jgi:hypothetical protein